MRTVLEDIKTELRNNNERFEKYFSKARTDDVADLYATDACLLPPGYDVVRGKANIGDFWQGAINMGVKYVKLETDEVEQHDTLAVEQGRYALIGPDKNLIDKGKYIVVWKNEDGQWKLYKDIWNSSFPEM